jgi:predicted RNA-binding protein associated with RNAse of E/G family
MQVKIHLERIGKPGSTFSEGFVSDDGVRVITRTRLTHLQAERFSRGWWMKGRIPIGKRIYWVAKYLFYAEWFDVVQFRALDGELLGTYCDICTPVERCGDGYHLIDLFLDLWIYPDGRLLELDWDEFEDACRQGLLSTDWQHAARCALERLKGLFCSGQLSAEYLRES